MKKSKETQEIEQITEKLMQKQTMIHQSWKLLCQKELMIPYMEVKA